MKERPYNWLAPTDRSIGKLYLYGLVSDGCVEASCRGGHQFGYQIMLARDAHPVMQPRPRSLIGEVNNQLEFEGVMKFNFTNDVSFN